MITPGYEYHRMSDQLLEDHLRHLKAAGRSQQTRDARENILGRLNNALPFGLVFATTDQIEGWLANLRDEGRSAWTLVIYTYHIKKFYQWVTSMGFLDGDPTGTVKQPRAPRALPDPVTDEELAAMLDELPEPIALAAKLAGFAGMRVSEIAACRREHITAEALLIPFGKGGKPGRVPTHPFIWEAVRGHPVGTRDDPEAGFLIRNRHGELVNGHWISQTARYWLNKIGLPGVHMHRLRHWYGTTIQATYKDIRVTQECMRHSSLTSTQGYLFVSDQARRDAVLALPVPGRALAE